MMRLVLAKPRLTYHIAVVYPVLFHKGDGHAIQQNINQKQSALLYCFFFLFVFIHNLYNQTGINFYVGKKCCSLRVFLFYFNFSSFYTSFPVSTYQSYSITGGMLQSAPSPPPGFDIYPLFFPPFFPFLP